MTSSCTLAQGRIRDRRYKRLVEYLLLLTIEPPTDRWTAHVARGNSGEYLGSEECRKLPTSRHSIVLGVNIDRCSLESI